MKKLKTALGLIETIGLPAAIEAADMAVKSANVKLMGIELTKGGGMVVVKIIGDVGAVNAAVSAGANASSKIGKTWATRVIPRPHESIEQLVFKTHETSTCYSKKLVCKMKKSSEVSLPEIEVSEEVVTQDISPNDKEEREEILDQKNTEYELVAENEKDINENIIENIIDNIEEATKEKKSDEICNRCGDPMCPRKKGEPKTRCMHYNDKEALI